MKIYLAYIFTGADKNKLKELIEKVTYEIEKLDHETFCFYRDIQDYGNIQTPRGKIIPTALENLISCDAVLTIINEPSKSIGIGIEIGFAKASNIPIYVLKKIDVESDYIDSISNHVVEYENLDLIADSLSEIL